MNLRGRTIEPLERIDFKPKENRTRRRSGRNKSSNKDEGHASSTQEKTPTKQTRQRPKKRYSKKSRQKSSVNNYCPPYFPPVEEVGIKDLLDEYRKMTPEDSRLLNEALVIYECKACNGFFRMLDAYLRHKQNKCTSLVVKTKTTPANWNPFLSKEVFSLFPSEDDSDDVAVVAPGLPVSGHLPDEIPNSDDDNENIKVPQQTSNTTSPEPETYSPKSEARSTRPQPSSPIYTSSEVSYSSFNKAYAQAIPGKRNSMHERDLMIMATIKEEIDFNSLQPSSPIPISDEEIWRDESDNAPNTNALNKVIMPSIKEEIDEDCSYTSSPKCNEELWRDQYNNAPNTNALNKGSSAELKMYPTFSITGNTINMKVEAESSTYGEINQARKNNRKKSVQKKPTITKRTRSFKVDKDFDPLMCTICKERFSKGSDLRYHKRDKHMNVILAYKCPLCKYYFINIVQLGYHFKQLHSTEAVGNFEIDHETLYMNNPNIQRIPSNVIAQYSLL